MLTLGPIRNIDEPENNKNMKDNSIVDMSIGEQFG
jgi:hypothetical protein